MSLLSSLVIPRLEKELEQFEPQIAQFLMQQLQMLGTDVLQWIEQKAIPADVPQ